MSDKKPHLKKKAPALTPEEQAAALATFEKRQAEEKAERERIEIYGKSLSRMPQRQLQGELRRTIRREYAGKPPQPQAGLTIAFATVLATVLKNTKTRENPFARLSAYPR